MHTRILFLEAKHPPPRLRGLGSDAKAVVFETLGISNNCGDLFPFDHDNQNKLAWRFSISSKSIIDNNHNRTGKRFGFATGLTIIIFARPRDGCRQFAHESRQQSFESG